MSEPSTVMILLRMIASLAAVVALIFAIAWFIKTYLKPDQWMNKGKEKSLKVLETLALDPKRRLVIVEWKSKKLLLGVSEGSINFLSSDISSNSENQEVSI